MFYLFRKTRTPKRGSHGPKLSETAQNFRLVLLWGYLIYLFIYFSTDIDNTSNTNKNNKMTAKYKKLQKEH